MKIAFISPLYFPFEGGIENLVQAVGERLVNLGHQVEVLTLTTSNKYPSKEVLNQVTIHRFRELVPGGVYITGISMLPYLILHGKDYDIVNVHNFHAMPLIWAALTCSACLVTSTHYHGHGHSPLANFLHLFYRPFGSWAVRRSRRVICASEFERDLVKAHFGISDDMLDIVSDGISLTELRSAQPFDLPGNPLLYVGRLERYKRIDLAIDALALLPEDYHLYVIGKGPEEQSLNQHVRHAQLINRVTFLKNVPDNELYRWYRSAKVLVMMSEAESFPMTSLEAIAAGCRVVCNSRPPFTELKARFEDAIYCVQAPTPRSVADQITRAAGEQEQLGVDLSSYDWDNIAQATLDVFQRSMTTFIGNRLPGR